MPNVKFLITDANLIRLVAAAKHFHNIPKDNEGDPLFTDEQWAKEVMRQKAISMVQQYETHIAQTAARIPSDDNLLS